MIDEKTERFAKTVLPVVYIAIVILSTALHYLLRSLPSDFSWKDSISLDLLSLILFFPLFIHCIKTMGKSRALLLFFTAAIFMGSLEALWVFLGRLGILGDAYDYTTGVLWFLEIPVLVSIGWFLWIYVYYFLVTRNFPKASILFKSVACGLLCLFTDLWMDPATVNLHFASDSANLWNWSATQSSVLFTVPLYNFIGWFLAGTFVTFIYQAAFEPKNSQAPSGKKSLLTIFLGWLIFVVFTKSIQIGLDVFLPGLNILPLSFTAGGALDATKIFVLALMPALALVCLGLYVRNALKSKNNRRDVLFLAVYFIMLLFNMSMAYRLQFAFPSLFLVYIMLSMLPAFALLIRYLILAEKNPG